MLVYANCSLALWEKWTLDHGNVKQSAKNMEINPVLPSAYVSLSLFSESSGPQKPSAISLQKISLDSSLCETKRKNCTPVLLLLAS